MEISEDAEFLDSRGFAYEDAVNEFRRHFIRAMLKRHKGHMGRTACELNMHRNTLTRTLRELGIRSPGRTGRRPK